MQMMLAAGTRWVLAAVRLVQQVLVLLLAQRTVWWQSGAQAGSLCQLRATTSVDDMPICKLTAGMCMAAAWKHMLLLHPVPYAAGKPPTAAGKHQEQSSTVLPDQVQQLVHHLNSLSMTLSLPFLLKSRECLILSAKESLA
jgi:hypothetical protein